MVLTEGFRRFKNTGGGLSHWHSDNDQDVVIPFTLVPNQIGYFTKRGQGSLEFIRLVRLVDHLEVES